MIITDDIRIKLTFTEPAELTERKLSDAKIEFV